MKDVKYIVEEIIDLYYNYGEADYIGEEVTQNEHMIQAAMLAEENGDSIEIILAAFLHDIGHLIPNTAQMSNLGVLDHEKIGANYLRSLGFPEIIPKLVESHVMTKRYLVNNDERYFNNLSNASKKTLQYQGCTLSQNESKKYENDPNFSDFIKIRKYDDMAKIKNKKINGLEYYRNLLELYLKNVI